MKLLIAFVGIVWAQVDDIPALTAVDGTAVLSGVDVVLTASSGNVSVSQLVANLAAVTDLQTLLAAAVTSAAQESTAIAAQFSQNSVALAALDASLSAATAASIANLRTSLTNRITAVESTHAADTASLLSSLATKAPADSTSTAIAALTGAKTATDAKITAINTTISSMRATIDDLLLITTGGTMADNVKRLDNINSSVSTLIDQLALNAADEHANEMAQSICVALNTGGGWMFAVRRACSNTFPDCNTVCAVPSLRVQDGQTAGGSWECINALHIYSGMKRVQSPTENINSLTLGYKAYRYNTCGGSYCGPNYCCCRAT